MWHIDAVPMIRYALLQMDLPIHWNFWYRVVVLQLHRYLSKFQSGFVRSNRVVNGCAGHFLPKIINYKLMNSRYCAIKHFSKETAKLH